MTAVHVHKGPPNEDWPIAICLDTSAAHALALYLGAEERSGRRLPDPVKWIRIALDAKLVADPASTTALAHLGDTSKEHKLCTTTACPGNTSPEAGQNSTASPRSPNVDPEPTSLDTKAQPSSPTPNSKQQPGTPKRRARPTPTKQQT